MRARNVQGPIGAGKSTVARSIALLKRVAPLKAEAAESIIADAKFDGPNLLHLNSVPWYLELALTGLTPELADVQLFGAARGAFTGAVERPGIFKQAMTGRRKRGEKLSEAVELTGGIVFLDEVGDLIPAHQAKLLPVLSSGTFYRIGAEGNAGDELTFRGTLIAASWKDLGGGALRPDLLSRIGNNRVTVPGIGDRMEDFDEILSTLESAVRESIIQSIDHITRVDEFAAREYWAARRNRVPVLTTQDRKRLAQVQWSRYGNLRGLAAVVEQIMARGLDAEDVLANLPSLEAKEEVPDITSAMIEGLRRRSPSSIGLAGHVAALETEVRQSVRDRLRSDASARRGLSERLNIPEDSLAIQIHQLARTRKRRK